VKGREGRRRSGGKGVGCRRRREEEKEVRKVGVRLT